MFDLTKLGFSAFPTDGHTGWAYNAEHRLVWPMVMGFKRQPIRSIGFLFSLLSRMHPTSSGLWSAWSDSNRQGLRRRILSAVCLAISSHADIHLKPTSYLIAISSIGSWMMLSIPIPFIMPNRLTGAPYLALGNYAIYAYLICLTHVPIDSFSMTVFHRLNQITVDIF